MMFVDLDSVFVQSQLPFRSSRHDFEANNASTTEGRTYQRDAE